MTMSDEIDKIQELAEKYDLSLDELRLLLAETDEARGLLTPAEAEQGLSDVVGVYVTCLASAAERVIDPAERLVIDRFVGQVVELLVDQLGAAIVKQN